VTDVGTNPKTVCDFSYRFEVIADCCLNFAHFSFKSPLWKSCRSTYTIHLRLIGKRIMDFLVVLSGPKISGRTVRPSPSNHSFCHKTRIIDLSFWQTDRRTERRTDSFLVARPHACSAVKTVDIIVFKFAVYKSRSQYHPVCYTTCEFQMSAKSCDCVELTELLLQRRLMLWLMRALRSHSTSCLLTCTAECLSINLTLQTVRRRMWLQFAGKFSRITIPRCNLF